MKLITFQTTSFETLNELVGFIDRVQKAQGHASTVSALYRALNQLPPEDRGIFDSLTIRISSHEPTDIHSVKEIIISSVFGLNDDLCVVRYDGLSKRMELSEFRTYLEDLLFTDVGCKPPVLFNERLISAVNECYRAHGENASVSELFNICTRASVSLGSIEFKGYYSVSLKRIFGVDYIIIDSKDGFKRKTTFKGLLQLTRRSEAKTA